MGHLQTIFPLVAQALLAAIAVRELARHVFPAVPRMNHPQLVTDVWAPLAIVAPLLFLAGRTAGSVRGLGWTGIGAPVVCGWIAVAAMLVVARPVDPAAGPRRRDLAAAGLTGLLLLLLGAAHVMSIWVGQCAFALAAVLLWVNTPSPGDPEHEETEAPARAGLGMLVALAAALAQGLLAWRAEPPVTAVVAGMAVGYAVIAICAAGAAGPGATLRVGLWSAVFGVLLGLGVLAFAVVLPTAIDVFAGSGTSVVTTVADGFGAYAGEAVALVLLAGVLPVLGRVPPRLRRPAGTALLVVLAVVVAVRVRAIAG
ncbi:MAG: hypothetical protein ACYTJ0_19365 [Planctomycetota bacterium]